MDLTPGQNFTQEDVELNRLWYKHTTLEGFKGHDRFVFFLSDVDNPSPLESFFISVHAPQRGERGQPVGLITLPLYQQPAAIHYTINYTCISIPVQWNQILEG